MPGITFEDPRTLPFSLPSGVDEVDAKWMQDLLRYRGTIPESCRVTSIEKKDVGMTAGYFSSIVRVLVSYSEETDAPKALIVKSWPPFEVVSRDAIKAMFVLDMKGYCEFSEEEWYPRPKCYLASYDEAENRWALVLEDATTYATHCVHENPLSLERVKKVIPGMVDFAVRFEGCDKEASLMHERTKHFPYWHDKAAKFEETGWSAATLFDEFVNKPDQFSVDDKSTYGFPHLSPFKSWSEDLGCSYSREFFQVYSAFWERADPAKGATCTVCHGDFRGDNLFWDEKNDSWLTIDYQLSYKGPIPSDLAYLMTSGTVEPSVYQSHTDEILHMFYDAFQAKTVAYTSDRYPFHRFKEEYVMMCHVLYNYLVAYGASLWKASFLDHDGGLFITIKEGGLGSGTITCAHLPEVEKRKRYWWCSAFNNLRTVMKDNGCPALLRSLPRKEVDFQAAFDTSKRRGCPWPTDKSGRFMDVDIPTAMALSAGALSEPKAREIATKDGLISMDKFNLAVVVGWSLLAAVKRTDHSTRSLV